MKPHKDKATPPCSPRGDLRMEPALLRARPSHPNPPEGAGASHPTQRESSVAQRPRPSAGGQGSDALGPPPRRRARSLCSALGRRNPALPDRESRLPSPLPRGTSRRGGGGHTTPPLLGPKGIFGDVRVRTSKPLQREGWQGAGGGHVAEFQPLSRGVPSPPRPLNLLPCPRRKGRDPGTRQPEFPSFPRLRITLSPRRPPPAADKAWGVLA